MSNPNDPFPVPPEGAPVGGHPPAPGQPGSAPPYQPPQPPPYGGQPPQPPQGQPHYQPPYGGPPGQPPYGGHPPQPPYPPHPGAPPKGNAVLLYGIIGALALIIVVGAVLFFTGALGGSRSSSAASSGASSAPTSSENSAASSYSSSSSPSYSGNSTAPSYSGNSASSYSGNSSMSSGAPPTVNARVRDVAQQFQRMVPARAGPITITQAIPFGRELAIVASFPRPLNDSSWTVLSTGIRGEMCRSPAGDIVRAGGGVSLQVIDSTGRRWVENVSRC